MDSHMSQSTLVFKSTVCHCDALDKDDNGKKMSILDYQTPTTGFKPMTPSPPNTLYNNYKQRLSNFRENLEGDPVPLWN